MAFYALFGFPVSTASIQTLTSFIILWSEHFFKCLLHHDRYRMDLLSNSHYLQISFLRNQFEGRSIYFSMLLVIYIILYY